MARRTRRFRVQRVFPPTQRERALLAKRECICMPCTPPRSWQGEAREAPKPRAHVVTPQEESRAALSALTPAVLLHPNADDGASLLAALRDTDVSRPPDDPPLLRALNALALAAGANFFGRSPT